jgi:predicted Ser/Thr protein kinase
VRAYVSGWADFEDSNFEIIRCSGLSNACYTVLNKAVGVSPKRALYRKYENRVINVKLEQIFFNQMGKQGLGPQSYHTGENYRIEEYFDGRPMTIWEMRNPFYMKTMA